MVNHHWSESKNYRSSVTTVSHGALHPGCILDPLPLSLLNKLSLQYCKFPSLIQHPLCDKAIQSPVCKISVLKEGEHTLGVDSPGDFSREIEVAVEFDSAVNFPMHSIMLPACEAEAYRGSFIHLFHDAEEEIGG